MPIKINPKNERIKREFLIYQKEVEGKAVITVDAIRKAIIRYETYTGLKDFTTFNRDQAVAFKRHLLKQKSARLNQPLSLSTVHATLNYLKEFFRWLCQKTGYKSRINPLDIGYFNLSDKDTRIAKAPTIRDFPTMEQVKKVLFTMPVDNEVARRNQAVIAFTLLTGMRDNAVASTLMKHVDLDKQRVIQKPDQVRTKFSKQIVTYFFPVGDDVRQIVVDWFNYLRIEKLYGENAPLFPKTAIRQNAEQNFAVMGLEPSTWSTSSPVRKIFKDSFVNVGLPYFNPHSLRKTLVQYGQRMCQNPEEFKAWSQNLGHEDVDTTFRSYGNVSLQRQSDIILGLKFDKTGGEGSKKETLEMLKALVSQLDA